MQKGSARANKNLRKRIERTMTVIYYLLTFAAGFFFGVFATALVAFSGDKEKRHDERKDDLR